MAEEAHIFDMVDQPDNRSRLDVRDADLGRPVGRPGARHPQHRRVAVFSAAAAGAGGAGKTHSLRALRAGAHRACKEVLVLAPTGKAVDEAMPKAQVTAA